MKKLSISFLGRDCPGAVSTVSQILGQSGCNIVEVTQTILAGEFAAIFIVQAPDSLEQEELRRLLLTGLEAAGQDLSVLVRPAVEGRWEDSVVSQPFTWPARSFFRFSQAARNTSEATSSHSWGRPGRTRAATAHTRGA